MYKIVLIPGLWTTIFHHTKYLLKHSKIHLTNKDETFISTKCLIRNSEMYLGLIEIVVNSYIFKIFSINYETVSL